MKKTLTTLLIFLLFLIASFSFPQITRADLDWCGTGIGSANNITMVVINNELFITVTNNKNKILDDHAYSLIFINNRGKNEPHHLADATHLGDNLIFTVGFDKLTLYPEIWDNRENSGVNFKINDTTTSDSSYDCSFDYTVPADLADEIKKIPGLAAAAAAAAALLAAPTPAPGVGATAPPPCTPTGFGTTGVNTGLGCIPTEPAELVKWILKYAILMGGGIAFLLSLFGGVSIILAGGNPEKINAGKEIIGSALTGLLFIIFSVFLLRFIGLDILQLPGFK